MYEWSKYEELRAKHSEKIAQTLDSPVMILDHWELTDIYVALVVLLLCGLVMTQWLLTLVLLGFVMGALPSIRRKNEKGFLYHLPYRYLGIPLRGMPNPYRKSEFSE